MEEARRRGLLPEQRRQELLQEAQQRGLTAQAQPQSVLEGVIDAFTQGAAFGFGDEATALEAAILGRTPEGEFFQFDQPFNERFNRALAAERAQQRQFREERPITATAAEIVGAVAVPVGAARAGAIAPRAATTLRGNVARGALAGAAAGGLFGAGEAEGGLEERARGAGAGAATGFVTGGALTAIGGGVSRALKRRRFKRAAPTRETLRETARQGFQRAERQGVVFTTDAVDAFADGLNAELKKQGFNARLHPRAAAAIDEIGSARGGDLPLEQLTLLRRIAQTAGQSAEPDERRIASIIIDSIDEFVDNVPTEGLVSGDSTAASAALRDARRLWRRVRNSEIIADAVERARNQASGFENGLRVQFRRIANNPRLMRGFSGEERTLINRVVRGSAVENNLRRLATLSFGGGIQRTGLSGLAGVAAGGAAGGVPGAIAVPATAEAARRGAEALTRGSAELAEAAVLSGATPPGVNIPAGLSGAITGLSGFAGGEAAQDPLVRALLMQNQARQGR